MQGNLTARHEKVAFMKVDGASEYTRMQGFTNMAVSSNPSEYTRQYVDEAFEETDITRYSPSIEYAFDEYASNVVHEDLIKIVDNELLGDKAIREIVIVDMTEAGANGGQKAKMRTFSVIPASEGDSFDAYTYSGSFKTKGAVVWGEATTTDEWMTCSFLAE